MDCQCPDMPFWRLKGDGFWELQNAELCSTHFGHTTISL